MLSTKKLSNRNRPSNYKQSPIDSFPKPVNVPENKEKIQRLNANIGGFSNL
jgi:hypothetical protein